MTAHRSGLVFSAAALLLATAFLAFAQNGAPALPGFGRDTVLVWKMENQGTTTNFVVRLAEFQPGRFLEWEDQTTQGTLYMPERSLKNAKTFVSARLFEGGVDMKGKDATTLWLSEKVYNDLKAKGKLKLSIDSVEGVMTLDGTDQLQVEVNRVPTMLPVIKVKDDRNNERWFLDSAENALLVKHVVRSFVQTLTSITTDKPNTLRWIKGKKLTAPH
jgi:hypothetical protein